MLTRFASSVMSPSSGYHPLMSGPYFQQPWPAFTYQGTIYDLSHLNEHYFSVVDTAGIKRAIAVIFGDHCFTRVPLPGDDPALDYPLSDRNPGYFCTERYGHSLAIVTHIDYAAKGKVWTMQGETFAIIPTVQHNGQPTYYGIMFTLDRARGYPVDLLMRVRTAFPYTESVPVTYGHSRFPHLVALKMSGKAGPGRIVGGRRQWHQL
jgi:hypothetical protein